MADPPSDAAMYPGLDMSHGLSVWEEMPLYLKYLDKFAARHVDSVKLLTSGPPTTLRALVHTLAGSCANLGLMTCSTLATSTEQQLAAGEPARAGVQALAQALQTALQSIDHLQLAHAVPPAPLHDQAPGGLVPGTDPALVQDLLQHLLQALDSDSLEPVAPVLEALGQCVAAQALHALIQRVEDFDFRGAERCTHALALELGLSLKGTLP